MRGDISRDVESADQTYMKLLMLLLMPLVLLVMQLSRGDKDSGGVGRARSRRGAGEHAGEEEEQGAPPRAGSPGSGRAARRGGAGRGAVVLSADLGFQITLLTVGSRFPGGAPLVARVELIRRWRGGGHGVGAREGGVGVSTRVVG